MPERKNQVKLGEIISSHGFKGLFKAKIYNQDNPDIEKYKNKTYIRSHKVDIVKKFRKGKNFIFSSSLFSSSNDVDRFIGEYIWVYENGLDKLKNDEYYHKDLIDCRVLSNTLKKIGTVKAIYNFGAGDLLELKEHEAMIRLQNISKKNIDLKRKTIILDKE